jgi:putative transcriptional regulator
MTVQNNFSGLLLNKSARDGRRVSIAEVSRDTGVNQKTLQDWYNNKVSRYDAPVIDALCNYFGCSVGDLIQYAK